jgi:hypothetical protein
VIALVDGWWSGRENQGKIQRLIIKRDIPGRSGDVSETAYDASRYKLMKRGQIRENSADT